MKMPDINNRILQLIELYANKSVKKFAEGINISQQTVNRLFNIDTRTHKFPLATTEILTSITEMYVDVNPEWLLTGRGSMLKPVGLMSTEEMDQHDKEVQQGKWQVLPEKPPIYKSDPRDASMIELQAKQIALLEEKISFLKGQIQCLEMHNSTDAPTVPHYHGVAQVGRVDAPPRARKTK